VTPSEGALFSALSRKEARSRYPHRARCAAGDVPAAGPDVSQSHHAYDKDGPVLNAIIMINPNALPNANALDAKFAIRFCRPPATVYALTGHQAMVPPTTCTPITSADAHKIDEMLRQSPERAYDITFFGEFARARRGGPSASCSRTPNCARRIDSPAYPHPRRRRAGIATTGKRRASRGSATINPRPLG